MNLTEHESQQSLIVMVQRYLERLEQEQAEIDSRNLAALGEYERRLETARAVLAHLTKGEDDGVHT